MPELLGRRAIGFPSVECKGRAGLAYVYTRGFVLVYRLIIQLHLVEYK